MICSQLSKSYLINLQEYNKCLKIKNTLLKNENIDKDYIYVLHEKMSDYIFNIVKYREIVINEIFEKAMREEISKRDLEKYILENLSK